MVKGGHKNFSKTYISIWQNLTLYKKFLLKNQFFMSLDNIIFIASRLKIHPAVHLNTSKALTSL